MAPRPRGRPPCSAQWDGERWVLDEDAAERAAARLLKQREKCRERRKATYSALTTMKPKLFKKLAKGQTTLNERDATTQSARDNPNGTLGSPGRARVDLQKTHKLAEIQ